MTEILSLPEPADAAAYRAIGRAIRRLVTDWRDPPPLEALAAEAGLSPFHFQRLFKRWAGVSPKRFAQFVTLGHARRLLSDERPLLDAAFELGLSGTSRLHDLFVTWEAMTPGQWKAAGAGLEIRWGVHDSPFGPALLGVTGRGLCWLGFVEADTGAVLAQLRDQFPDATLIEDAAGTRAAAERAFRLSGQDGPLPVVLQGTPFQLKVWAALLSIPEGSCTSYGELARAIGQPQASRAVGAAVGRNPVSWLVPCHRVILQSGVVHNYRWGVARKQAMLALEAARQAESA